MAVCLLHGGITTATGARVPCLDGTATDDQTRFLHCNRISIRITCLQSRLDSCGVSNCLWIENHRVSTGTILRIRDIVHITCDVPVSYFATCSSFCSAIGDIEGTVMLETT